MTSPQAGFARGIYELFPRQAQGLDNDSTTTRRYMITGANDEEDAIYLLRLGAPEPLNNLVQSSPDVTEVNAQTGTYIGTMKWVAPESPEAQQERPDNWPAPKLTPLKLNDPVRWSWRGQANQFQIAGTAAAMVSYFGDTAKKRDFKGAINVDPDDGQVGGTTRYFFAEEWTAEVVLDKSYVTQSFLDSLRALRGHTNQNAFSSTMFAIGNSISFPALSMLYLTSEGTEEEDGVRTRFNFLVGENETSAEVGGITGITKNAHDYLWPLWEKTTDGTTGYVVRQAAQAYVHQLYEPTAWSALEAILS
jgi:hypothetical protein